ncbi:hypothetical protein VZQ01_10085 [Myxococcus faecalis]|uniref:hypothetical protein n=1 Tax=Myxococcus faecalis TaxID=3115646 RepID=UPI0024CBA03B|nr:hypothetical protein MFMH1_19890 [Myxococcus sp. MH1]
MKQAAPDVYATAPVFADVHVTSDGKVAALAGTPPPARRRRGQAVDGGPHHLTSSRDGKQFEPIAFR